MPLYDTPRAPKHSRFPRSLVFRGRLLAMKPSELNDFALYDQRITLRAGLEAFFR